MILDPGLNLTLRPMRYPTCYDFYKSAIKNNWEVEEVKMSRDAADLKYKMTDSERHLVQRLVAFFATGDNIVAHNLVLNLYKHVNAPEARLFYGRQLFEEMRHVDFYLKLVEEYIPDETERKKAFEAVENIPSVRRKAQFAFKWISAASKLDKLETDADRQQFLLCIIAFAAVIEGLFFMGAFTYVYYLRDKGLLPGLAEGTNWVFRDESVHMDFAFHIVDIIRHEYPHLFTPELNEQIQEMLADGIACELEFARDSLKWGVLGVTETGMQQFLEFCADQRLIRLGLEPVYHCGNPFDFMILQEVAPLTNFFEKTVTEYQNGAAGDVSFDEDF